MCSKELINGANWNQIKSAAQGLVDFIASSPTPFHVVDNLKKLLNEKKFQELPYTKMWKLEKGGLYYYTLNNSAIIAFAVGKKYEAGNGISMIGTHTDSPCLKLKPNFHLIKSDFEMVDVSTYGGGIWPSWFDRDLTVAGRVAVKNSKGGLSDHLINISDPILRIPHLAIHLDRKINELFSPNLENELRPILSTSVVSSYLNNGATKSEYSPLSLLIADRLGCEVGDIMDCDLSVIDAQPAAMGGVNDEFIFSPRLDNLFNTYCAIKGLISSLEGDSISNEPSIRMVVCFDNEEAGSLSFQGAHTKAFPNSLRRIEESLKGNGLMVENSFFLSADQAHALNPNYPEKHEVNHKITLNGGIVLKHNVDQRYATTGYTSSIIRLVANSCEVPFQQFCMRNDMPCGSTIGPITTASVGMKSADVGFPMLSMHSIREMCSTTSVLQALIFYKAYFLELPRLLSSSSESK